MSYSQKTSLRKEEKIGSFWLTAPRGDANRSKAVLRLFWQISKAQKSEKSKSERTEETGFSAPCVCAAALEPFFQAEAAASAEGPPASVTACTPKVPCVSCHRVLFISFKIFFIFQLGSIYNILYWFQVYNPVIRRLCNLRSDLPSKSSTCASDSCPVMRVLLTTVPMLFFTSP